MTPDRVVWLVSVLLFLCGLAALLLRRQLLAMLLGLELMINAANLNFVFYGREWSDAAGWTSALWVLAAAAAEAVVGLTLILALNRLAEPDTDSVRELEG
ncbi:MAG: NADH-quinone oxidoreductase subunit NuoK [Elusimicrobia bacterium]|nr:NADH-quinone oxidoreductase subunit NuoK [Elusimicrobiota bacterium]